MIPRRGAAPLSACIAAGAAGAAEPAVKGAKHAVFDGISAAERIGQKSDHYQHASHCANGAE